MQRSRRPAPILQHQLCGFQAEVEASWAGRRQAVLLGRQDDEKRAVEAAGRLQVARERAQEREGLRVQQNAALQARSAPRFLDILRVCMRVGQDSLLHTVVM